MFIDTHTHLFYPNFEGEVDNVIERAVQSGVEYMIVPGTDLATSLQAIELAQKYDIIYASVRNIYIQCISFVIDLKFQYIRCRKVITLDTLA